MPVTNHLTGFKISDFLSWGNVALSHNFLPHSATQCLEHRLKLGKPMHVHYCVTDFEGFKAVSGKGWIQIREEQNFFFFTYFGIFVFGLGLVLI